MARTHVDVAVRVACQGQRQSFIGTEDGLRLGSQRQVAVLVQRQVGQRSLQEFIVRSELPEGGFHAQGRERQRQNQERQLETSSEFHQPTFLRQWVVVSG